MSRQDELVRYVGGPLEGGYTTFPRDGMVSDGLYEECPIPTGSDKAERHVLRRVGDGWAFVHAGPVVDGLELGRRVFVDTDGGRVEGVFARVGTPDEGVTVESPAADGPYRRDVAWVHRTDSGEVEPFQYDHIKAA
jgi:hypothetical protein